jgi:chemotaxis protein histidine kinase CheA
VKKQGRADASVTAYADHEVIVPAKTLQSYARKTGTAESLDSDAISRAEAALAELSVEFDDWMRTECDRLDAARKAIAVGGLSKGSTEVLFRAAHDIKGEAATFGFPVAGEIAASLCRIVMHTPQPASLPLDLIGRHVDAVRAVVRENLRADDSTAREVAVRLGALAEAFLRDINRDDADWLAEHASPPLSPGSP